MLHPLSHPQPQPHPQFFIMMEKAVAWISAIGLMAAAYPFLKELYLYLMWRLYEIFIQYGYLF